VQLNIHFLNIQFSQGSATSVATDFRWWW